MTFADQYKTHAYADLIREAETQGIGIGVEAERERIIGLLEFMYSELMSCLKEDDCKIRAHAVSVCIDDIQGETNDTPR
jgi:hypothetical protein